MALDAGHFVLLYQSRARGGDTPGAYCRQSATPPSQAVLWRHLRDGSSFTRKSMRVGYVKRDRLEGVANHQ